MDYDPIKDRLIRLFERSVTGQRAFFTVLHAVFLRSWYVRKIVAPLVDARPAARVLDAGTGFGQYTDWLLRRWRDVTVTAVDIKDDYLARLSDYAARTPLGGRVSVRRDDLTDLETEGPFDLILSVDVMEHIEDDAAVFRNFHRVLADGGYVVINTPSDQGGSNVRGTGETSFIGEHVRDGYGADELAARLAAAGLRVEAVVYGYGPAGSLAWRLLVQGPMRLLAVGIGLLPLVAVYYVAALPLGLLLNAMDAASRNDRGTGLTVVARKVA